MPTRTLPLLAALLVAPLLEGCTAIGWYTHYNWGDQEFRPNADGPAAVAGAIAVIPGLHLAQVRRSGVPSASTSGTPGTFGPGVARFNGVVLEAFSLDGSLDPEQTAGSLPGFFLRSTSALRSGRYGSEITGIGTTDGVVAVGKWFARFEIPPFIAGTRGNLVNDGLLAYAIGPLTPAVALPQTGTARYQVSAATVVGFEYAATTGGLAVQWGGATPKVGMDLSLWANRETQLDFRLLTTGGLDNPSLSEISVRAGTSTFGGSGIPLPTCRQAGSGDCQAQVEGFFAGGDAGHAGLTYRITGPSDALPYFTDDDIGAAAFRLSDFVAPPAPPAGAITLLDQTNPNAFAMAYAASNVFAGPAGASGPPAMATQAADGQLTGFNFPSSPGSTVNVSRGTTQSPAAETGSDGLISWGRWTNGTTAGSGPGFGALTLSPNQGFHYVVGAPTPAASMPASGTATFNLLGATKPTFGDGALVPGTFTGSMAVQWGGAASTKVGVDFTVNMPGDASYRVLSNGGLANPAISQVGTSGSSSFNGTVTPTGTGRACPGGPCFANMNGFFAGPNAERAGVAYTIGQAISTTIQGAAAFTR